MVTEMERGNKPQELCGRRVTAFLLFQKVSWHVTKRVRVYESVFARMFVCVHVCACVVCVCVCVCALIYFSVCVMSI